MSNRKTMPPKMLCRLGESFYGQLLADEEKLHLSIAECQSLFDIVKQGRGTPSERKDASDKLCLAMLPIIARRIASRFETADADALEAMFQDGMVEVLRLITVSSTFSTFYQRCNKIDAGLEFSADSTGVRVLDPEELYVPDTHYEVERIMAIEDLDRAMSTLTPREEFVLRIRYGIHHQYSGELTYESIGAILGTNKNRAREIERRALRKMRHPSRSKKLVWYISSI